MKNYNLNEDAIREAAYYIWKNAGCPANSSLQDWNAAIEQLSSCNCSKKNTASKTTSIKTSTLKAAALKKSSTKTTANKSKNAKKSK